MKLRYLILPLLISSAVSADALLPSDDSVYYSDKRIRYTAKLGEVETAEQRAKRVQAEKAAQAIKQKIAKKWESNEVETRTSTATVPLRELNETLNISFRDRALPSSIRSVTPPGWVVDLQIDKSLYNTHVSFSGETTYAQALKDILEPQGLTFLAYRNMKPKPLIVVTRGGK